MLERQRAPSGPPSRDGQLHEAAQGSTTTPLKTRFGPAPASDEEMLHAFLEEEPFLITGLFLLERSRARSVRQHCSPQPSPTNTRRTGDFTFGERRFLLRCVRVPEDPPPEWCIVDRLQYHEMAGVFLEQLAEGLVTTLRDCRLDTSRLLAMAKTYGPKATLALVASTL